MTAAALAPLASAAPPATTTRAPSSDNADADAPSFAATLDGAVAAAGGGAAGAAPADSPVEPGGRHAQERERRDPDALVALLAGVVPAPAQPRAGEQALAAAGVARDHAAVAGAADRLLHDETHDALSGRTGVPGRPDQPAAADRAAAGRLDPAAAAGDSTQPAPAPLRTGLQPAVAGTADVARPDAARLEPRAAELPAAAPDQRPPAAPALKLSAKTATPTVDGSVRADAAAPATTSDASRAPVVPLPMTVVAEATPRRGSASRDEADGADPAAATPQAAGGTSAAAPDAAATKSAAVAAPVGSPAWPAAVAQQLARLGPGTVELQLNPAELGPLKVKLALAGGHAQVAFVSEHLAVRQALEAALPQLRTSFEGNGISLGQATVGSGSGEPSWQQQPGQSPQPDRPAAPRAARPDAVAAAPTSSAGFDAFA